MPISLPPQMPPQQGMTAANTEPIQTQQVAGQQPPRSSVFMRGNKPKPKAKGQDKADEKDKTPANPGSIFLRRSK